jgi:DNA-binding PucR family transcriptional regulator
MRTGQDSMASQETQVAQLVASVGAALNADLAGLTLLIHRRLSTEIEELKGDERILQLLASSIEGNVDTILHMFQHGIDIERVEPPSAALEYSRRLAERGVPVNALVRAYRLGQDTLLQRSLGEVRRQSDAPDVASLAVQRIVEITFMYIDWMSQRVVTAYESERERWLQNRSAVRAARTRDLLAGKSVDMAAAEAALGYRLEQCHLGIVAWMRTGAPGEDQDQLSPLERFVLRLGERFSCPARPLFVPYDNSSAWAWLPIGRRVAIDPGLIRQAAGSGGRIMVAVGEPAHGVDGFRITHTQAVQTQAVALLGEADAPQVSMFRQVGVAALLSADVEAARAWVSQILGRLATDDDHSARLRETLRVFLATGGSYTASAAQLAMHKNSVKYRVEKAEQERGRPIRGDRLDVELALHACHWLGHAVLNQPT